MAQVFVKSSNAPPRYDRKYTRHRSSTVYKKHLGSFAHPSQHFLPFAFDVLNINGFGVHAVLTGLFPFIIPCQRFDVSAVHTILFGM